MKLIKIIPILILILSSSIVLALDNAYLIELNYSDGKFNLINIEVIKGFYRGKNYNEYIEDKIKVISYDNITLWENRLPNVDGVIFYENEEGGGSFKLNNTNITETLPYFKEGKYIKIYNKDSEVFSIDVTKYSDYCGNGICNSGEESSCSEDCKIQQSLFKRLNFKYIIASILILFILLFLFYKARKRKNELSKQKGTQKIQIQQIKQQPKQVDEKAALLEALKRIREKRKF